MKTALQFLSALDWDAIRGMAVRIAWAIAEVSVVLAFGILPLAVALIRINNQSETYTEFLFSEPTLQLIGKGQLFFYAFSVIGTLVWLAIADFRFSMSVPRVIIALLVVVLSITITGTGIFDPTITPSVKAWTVQGSVWAFSLVYVLYFGLLMIRSKEAQRLSKTLSAEADKTIGKARGIM